MFADKRMTRIKKEEKDFNSKKEAGLWPEILRIDFTNTDKIRVVIKPEYMEDYYGKKIEGKEYQLELDTKDYPISAPRAQFIDGPKTHVNIYRNGQVCLGGYEWSPSIKLVDFTQTIILLMKHPNPADAANPKPTSTAEAKTPTTPTGTPTSPTPTGTATTPPPLRRLKSA